MTALTNLDIDRKCAEIMGWREVLGYRADDDDYVIATEKWHPSLDLNQAWQVVKHLDSDYRIELYTDDIGVHVTLVNKSPTSLDRISFCATNENPSRAICLACIQAWEED